MSRQNIVRFNKSGNIKLGRMWSFSKLYGNQEHYVQRLGLTIKGTCGQHCQGCKEKCYVRASYRYGSVIYNHAMNTLAFRNNIDLAFSDIDGQLTRARKKPACIRIDQSGELETSYELYKWIELSAAWPDIRFYVYTKNYQAVRESLDSLAAVPNMVVLISIWHENGLNEYKEFSKLDNIKCFVYIDGYNYPMNIQTYCMAYNASGKLDHNITCDKCKKCFDCKASHKVIGCYSH